MKNRWFYPFLVVLFGLLTAQAISTAQVYLSNVALYRTLVTVKEAGYLPIPNERTMPHLQQFGPAFFGGIFFTLTVGAGLSLLTLAAAWIWDRIFHRERTVLIPYFVFWLGFLMAVKLWHDVLKRLSLDRQRIFATGFSGGARVSSFFNKIIKNPVRGLIACGAGISEMLKIDQLECNFFYGISGIADFNYQEMRKLDRVLDKTRIMWFNIEL